MMFLQVAAVIKGVLGKAVPPHEPLSLAGLDSLGAVEVQKELSRQALHLSQIYFADSWSTVLPSTRCLALLKHTALTLTLIRMLGREY